MVNEIIKNENSSEDIYSSIRSFVITAQHKVYAAVNTAMVVAYWEIGEQIYKASGENDRAEYGKNLLKYLSDRLTDCRVWQGLYGTKSASNASVLQLFPESAHAVCRIELVALPHTYEDSR